VLSITFTVLWTGFGRYTRYRGNVRRNPRVEPAAGWAGP
jgi:hypothetical protein